MFGKMKSKYIFENGKYIVERDDTTYETILYRNGDYWESTIKGHKLFHAMLNDIDDLMSFKKWYDEAMEASNEAGFACMSAADVIRWQDAEIQRLREYEFMYKELQS